ncbi:MAG: NYN domain-containing protein [Acidobacteria bacterium]|nr:NYN domain-containing protein [Acidobacteriota bacterium]
MPTAILVDGSYFIKRYRTVSNPSTHYDPKAVARDLFTWCLMHLEDKDTGRRELYRIFFYDCPPLVKKAHNPVSKKPVDFSRTKEAGFRLALHSQLRKQRKVALRLGRLADYAHWAIRPAVTKDLLSGKMQIASLSEDDVLYEVRQKGVDMRIGLDIASLAFKRQVDQIVLIAGDSDFVPAAKLARREGIDFILDPMWQDIPEDLHEHIDGLRSTCPKKPLRQGQGDGAEQD